MRALPPLTPLEFGLSPEETLAFMVWEGRVPRQCIHEGVATPEDIVIVASPRLVRGFRLEYQHPTELRVEPCHTSHIPA
jgi:hypothetical protein